MLRRHRALPALAVVAGLLAGAAAAQAFGTSGPATVATPAERLDVPDDALLTSDSAWLGIKTYGAIDAVQGFHHSLALASCRRRFSTSCTNYDGSVPTTAYAELENHAGRYRTVIQAAGYDDSDHDFVSDFEQIVGAARRDGYGRVVWVTLRENVAYDSSGHVGYAGVYERNNDALHELLASGQYPELVIADWAEYARNRPQWFSADGIHIRRLGAYAAADYISRKMAFLDGRACPVPTMPGEPVADPCPDPDLTGPVADLAALYPTDAAGPDSGLELIWEGHGAWPDPPWWQE